jgi:O-antigen/teichoic acid export membrane protein
MTESSDEQDPARGDHDEDDVGALHRGARANLAGHGARFAQPLLLLAAARLYGAEAWGVFVAGQAAYALLAKLSLLGLERGLVYWVPRAERMRRSLGIRAAALRVFGAALPVGLLAALASPIIAAEKGVSAATWALMAAGLVPLALVDLLIHATVGRRRMDVQVVVRDVLVPLSTLGLAVVLELAGAGEWGLGLAFALGQWIGLAAAARACLRLFGREALFGDSSETPPELLRFAYPQWGSELSLALLYRADALVLTAFSAPAVVGIYGVALQFGNTVRSLRGSYDPRDAPVTSDIAAGAANARLDAAIAYAVRVVMLLQAPVAALFLFLGGPLLTFFGPGFEAGYDAVVILSVGWTLHGVLGLASAVLGGLGESRRLLVTTLFALALEGALLFALVPTMGMEGAALALVGAFLGQAALQVLMLRALLGRIPAPLAFIGPSRRVAVAAAVGLAGFAIGEAQLDGAGPFAGFIAFAAVYLPSALVGMRPKKAL